MPIYEYHCDNCSHEFETIQKISEEPLKTCPQCGQDSLRKKVSRAAFRLKGGGWYETDFKSGADKKRNLGGESATGDGGTASTKESGTADAPKTATPDSGGVTSPAKSSGGDET